MVSEHAKNSLKRNLGLLTWLNFFTDFVLFAPVAILYFAQVTGSMTLGMSIFSVAYTCAALFELPTGIISDLVGRKTTTVLGAFSAALAVTLYALGGSYWILIVGAILQGLSRAFYSGNNEALLHDTLREAECEDEYQEHLGKTSSMFQVALACSAVLGGLIAAISFPLVMWLSVIPQAICVVLALFLVEPTKEYEVPDNPFTHLKEAIQQFQLNPKLQLLTWASSLRFAVGESVYFLRAAFIQMLWPVWALGIASLISNVTAALSFYLSGKFITKHGAYQVLNFEIVFGRVLYFLALLFPSVGSPILMASTSITFGVGTVATSTLLQKEFTAKQRATLGSLNSLAGSLAFGIASLIFGYLADTIGVRSSLFVAQGVLLVPLFLYSRLKKAA